MEQITPKVERQKRAREFYRKAFKSALLPNLMVFTAVTFIILALLLFLPMSHPPTWLFMVAIAAAYLRAHKRAIAAVRGAGLLDESREIIARTATTFEGETLLFHYPSSSLGKAALVIGICAFTALMGWVWRHADSSVGAALGAAGFALFLCLTLLTLATAHLPNASLDRRGVFAYRYSFVPTLVRWREIESAEVYRFTNFNNGADLFTVTLKNAGGQTLLMLNPNTFAGSSAQWQQQFIAEIERRLTAATS